MVAKVLPALLPFLPEILVEEVYLRTHRQIAATLPGPPAPRLQIMGTMAPAQPKGEGGGRWEEGCTFVSEATLEYEPETQRKDMRRPTMVPRMTTFKGTKIRV